MLFVGKERLEFMVASMPTKDSSVQPHISCQPSQAITICYAYDFMYQTLVQHERRYCRNHSYAPARGLESVALQENTRTA